MRRSNLAVFALLLAASACRSREPTPRPGSAAPGDAGMRRVALSRPEPDLVNFAAGQIKGRERRCKPGSLQRNFADNDQQPDHLLLMVDAFAVDRRAVSCVDFDRCVESGRCPGTERLHRSPLRGIDSCEDGFATVSYDSALAYCRWRDMDLPTLYQWQRALRGVDGWRFPSSPDFDPSKRHEREISTPEGVQFSPAGAPQEWLRDEDCAWQTKDASDTVLAHMVMPAYVYDFSLDVSNAGAARFRCVNSTTIVTPSQPGVSPRKSG